MKCEEGEVDGNESKKEKDSGTFIGRYLFALLCLKLYASVHGAEKWSSKLIGSFKLLTDRAYISFLKTHLW